jgi:hypothetical protein
MDDDEDFGSDPFDDSEFIAAATQAEAALTQQQQRTARYEPEPTLPPLPPARNTTSTTVPSRSTTSISASGLFGELAAPAAPSRTSTYNPTNASKFAPTTAAKPTATTISKPATTTAKTTSTIEPKQPETFLPSDYDFSDDIDYDALDFSVPAAPALPTGNLRQTTLFGSGPGVSNPNPRATQRATQSTQNISSTAITSTQNQASRRNWPLANSHDNEPPTHHRIDYEAAKTWVYPVNISFRDYQYNIVKRALLGNVLCALPTGE